MLHTLWGTQPIARVVGYGRENMCDMVYNEDMVSVIW